MSSMTDGNIGIVYWLILSDHNIVLFLLITCHNARSYYILRYPLPTPNQRSHRNDNYYFFFILMLFKRESLSGDCLLRQSWLVKDHFKSMVWDWAFSLAWNNG